MRLKMKKITIILSCLIFLVLILPTFTYAATINFNIATNTQNYKITDQNEPLTIIMQLGNFVNIPENIVLGYTAKIEYDKSIFESITATGENGWNAVYNNSTCIIEGDTAKAVANTDIAKISFKLKENINTQDTTIKLKNILISDGDFEIKTEKEITVNITNQKKYGRKSSKNN